MTFGLVDVGYSLPEGQAVKLIFFAPCLNSTDRSHHQAFRKNLQSRCPKCVIGPAQISNLYAVRKHVKNKTIFYTTWPSTRHLDTHLAKRLAFIHQIH